MLIIIALLASLPVLHQRDARAAEAPYFQEISERYDNNASDFDALTAQLEGDSEITELYCDRHTIVVTTADETFLEGDNDQYTTKYAPLCRFSRKVTALRSERGIRFPHRFREAGSLAVSSFLEARRDPEDVYDDCAASLYEGEYGSCEIRINENWSAVYVWEPFCLGTMRGEVGC